MNRRGAIDVLGKLMALLGLSRSSALAQVAGGTANETFQRMTAEFPYRIVTVPGRRVLEEWEKLRRQGDGWPVIVGDDDALERIMEQFSLDDAEVFPPSPQANWTAPPLRPVEQILAEARTIDVPAKLQELYDREYGADPFEIPPGPWPEPGSIVPMTITVDTDIRSGKTYPRVHIVVAPANDPSEVPAYLRWGGWNACPDPEVHVAVHRKWRAQYGAEIVGISGDVINLRVARRPATREEAMALAREQFLYCSDIVLQGTDTLESLATSLMESDYWYFWWD